LYRIQDIEKKNREFEEVAFRYMNPLYSAALRMTGDKSEAQDLVQDSYLRAYRFFDRFKRGTNFRAWLFKILRNVYINKYYKELRIAQVVEVSNIEESGDLVATTTPENEIFNSLLDDEVTNAVGALPEDFRIVIILSDLEGFSYKEIAETLDCPMGTVMSRLHRGRKLLRKSLYEYAKERGYVKD
jgi:RNA polymerase sigma-70 factor (ECF subfamily)